MKKSLVILATVLTFISCGKDKAAGPSSKNPLIGKWYIYDQKTYVDNAGQLTYYSTLYSGSASWMIFNEDGTGVIESYVTSNKYPFTYTYKKGVELESSAQSPSSKYEIKVEGGTLTRTSKLTRDDVNYVMIETLYLEPKE